MFIEAKRITDWMTFLRDHPDHRDRFLECFWPSQMQSKLWLIEKMRECRTPIDKVYIFGGWFGIMAQLVEEAYWPRHLVSIDIDPLCARLGPKIGGYNIEFETCSMEEYNYPWTPDVVINTSCEHITQEVYDLWWAKVPVGTYFFLQGNDFFKHPEHIRCSKDMNEFLDQCRLNNQRRLKFGTLDCPGPFTRYMVWGKKE